MWDVNHSNLNCSTPLNKSDTADFKAREVRASRLAQEIENSDTYRRNIEMENEGDGDEEARFSAVIRNTASSPVSGSNSNGVGSGTSSGKLHVCDLLDCFVTFIPWEKHKMI